MGELHRSIAGIATSLIDESPNGYKPAKDVIDAVVQAGPARVAYTLTPIASLKGVD